MPTKSELEQLLADAEEEKDVLLAELTEEKKAHEKTTKKLDKAQDLAASTKEKLTKAQEKAVALEKKSNSKIAELKAQLQEHEAGSDEGALVKKLQDTEAALEATTKQLNAAKADAEGAGGQAVVELTQKLKATEDALDQMTKKAHEALTGTLLGYLRCKTGNFVIGDEFSFNTEWKNDGNAVGGGWVINLSGPYAEHYAKSQVQNKGVPKQLADGTWRLDVGDQIKSNMIEKEIQTLATMHEHPVTIQSRPASATGCMAKDATRAKGAGVFPLTNSDLGAFKSGPKPVEVYGQWHEDGSLKALVVRPSQG